MKTFSENNKISKWTNIKITLILFSIVLSFTTVGIVVGIGLMLFVAIKEYNLIVENQNLPEADAVKNKKIEVSNINDNLNLLINQKQILLNSKEMKEYEKRRSFLTSIKQNLKQVKKYTFDKDKSTFLELDTAFIDEVMKNKSEEYKEQIIKIKELEKEYKKEGFILQANLLVENSQKKGQSLQKKVGKELVKNFLSEVNIIIKNNKKDCYNYETLQLYYDLIEIVFNEINQARQGLKVVLDKNLLTLQKQKFMMSVYFEIAKEEEKILSQEEKEMKREEEKARKEIEKLILKNETEKKNASDNVLYYREKLEAASEDKKESFQNELDKWIGVVDKLIQQSENIQELANNIHVGYVYVIKNEKSFKDNILKIGMTKRPEPQKRFNELSGAAVPFVFEPLILIKSENAYKLEKDMHNFYDSKRVNKINKRKEYFHLNINDVINYLDENKIDFQTI